MNKKYDINKVVLGNLYFIKNSNKALEFIRFGIFYNIEDGEYIDLETKKTYSCYNDILMVGDVILDFNDLVMIKDIFSLNNIFHKKHMTLNELQESLGKVNESNLVRIKHN